MSVAYSPARRLLYASKFAFEDLVGLSSPFSDTTEELNYSTLLAEAENILSTNPSTVVIETVTTLPSGRTIKAMRIRDDGVKPLVLVSLGIHGNEMNLAKGVMTAASEFAGQSDNTILSAATESVGLVVILGVNPDGMAADTRRNASLVNLNRNWPWFWSEALDTDKGGGAADQPETVGIQTWAMPFIRRIVAVVDTHAWHSKTTWGYLVEQIYHTPEAERNARLAFQYTKALMAKRDWAGFTIKNLKPELTEYRSYRKPYLYTWFRQFARPDCVGYLVEAPESENIGVSSTVGMDLVLGALAAAVDATTAHNLQGVAVTPALAVLNSNSNFSTWNTAENRPNFFSYTRVNLNGADSRRRFRIERALTDPFPTPLERSAYCTRGDVTMIAGGLNGDSVSTCYRQSAAGVLTTAPSLPLALHSAAIATDGNTVWLYGGITDSLTYKSTLYAKSWSGSDAWVVVADVTLDGAPLALQRHTMHWHNGYLYVIGGRTSGAVSKDIYKVDPSSGQATIFAQLSGLTQRHTSWLNTDGDGFIYVFGGDGGATVKSSIERLNLTTAARVIVGALPAARNRQTLAATTDNSTSKVYVCFGCSVTSPTVSTDFKADMYVFDAATETVSTLSYKLDSFEDDHGDVSTIPPPAFANGIARYRSKDDVLTFIGGADLNSVSKETWEMTEGEAMLGLQRTATSHGFFRSTQSFPVAPSDYLAIVTRVGTNTVPSPTSMAQMSLVGIISGNGITARYIDPMRRVPYKLAGPMSTPIYVRAGETASLRAYLRVWNAGKSVNVEDGFQVLKVTDGKAMAAFDLIEGTSKAAVIHSPSMNLPIGTSGSARGGVFSPYWGSRWQVNQQVMGFSLAGGNLQSLELWFVSTDSVAATPSGNFELRWDNGTAQTHVFPVLELNHTRGEIEWRRDVVFWRITPTASGLTFSLWYYGTVFSVEIECTAGTITGYTMDGSGVIDHGPYL